MLPSERVCSCNTASCMIEIGKGADRRPGLATDLVLDWVFQAFFTHSAMTYLAGEGGGVAPLYDTALHPEGIYVICTDKGGSQGPIQVLKCKD